MLHRHRALALLLAGVIAAEGCFVYRPVTLPVREGTQLRVTGSALAVYDAPALLTTAARCHATSVSGSLAAMRGDTITLAPVWAMSHARPRVACSRFVTATMLATPDATRITQRHFSVVRTTGLVLGGAVVALATAAAMYAHDVGSCHCSYARTGRAW